MVEYYQRKIPLFYNWRRFWELVLAVCTAASLTLTLTLTLTLSLTLTLTP